MFCLRCGTLLFRDSVSARTGYPLLMELEKKQNISK